MWSFKWKLSAFTFTSGHLFLKILENEIGNFGRNLPLGTFGNEGLKERFKISKIAKFESDLLKTDEDIAPQSRQILQTLTSYIFARLRRITFKIWQFY